MHSMNIGRPLTKNERALLELRNRVQSKFDDIWQRRREIALQIDPHRKLRNYRKSVRRWLAKQLEIPERACNIGDFDIRTCERAIRVLEPISRRVRHIVAEQRRRAA